MQKRQWSSSDDDANIMSRQNELDTLIESKIVLNAITVTKVGLTSRRATTSPDIDSDTKQPENRNRSEEASLDVKISESIDCETSNFRLRCNDFEKEGKYDENTNICDVIQVEPLYKSAGLSKKTSKENNHKHFNKSKWTLADDNATQPAVMTF